MILEGFREFGLLVHRSCDVRCCFEGRLRIFCENFAIRCVAYFHFSYVLTLKKPPLDFFSIAFKRGPSGEFIRIDYRE
jgi:hypothetical protein